jgi:RNA polymerase sigma factor (TIGR02999 family)
MMLANIQRRSRDYTAWRDSDRGAVPVSDSDFFSYRLSTIWPPPNEVLSHFATTSRLESLGLGERQICVVPAKCRESRSGSAQRLGHPCGGAGQAGVRLRNHGQTAINAEKTEASIHRVDADRPAAQSADTLFATVYARLKAMAARKINNQRAGITIETTALVHELYLRVCANRELEFNHPSQFFAYAARAMRHLLCDRARDRMRQHAGGDWQRVTLTGTDTQIAADSAEQALSLDEALTELERADQRAARVVELRYFAGMTLEQVAELLDLNRRTVDRDWRFARAFLNDKLS